MSNGIITQEKFIELNSTVELIISNTDLNIKEAILNVVDDLEDLRDKRFAYHHMSTLFLNAALNRLNILGKNIEPRLHESRKIIRDILETIQ